MTTNTILSIKKDQLASFLRNIKHSLKEENGVYYVLDQDGTNVKCASTDVPITIENFGVVTKGSIKFYSNSPVAINDYLIKKMGW